MTNLPERAPSSFKKARVPLIILTVVASTYLLLALLGGGWGPRHNDNFSWKGQKPLLIAHRGVALAVPEDTIPAIEEAQRAGFVAVEIDVRRTKDGELVLFHDKTAQKMLGINTLVNDLTLAELRRHPMWLEGKQVTNSISTLREVFAQFGSNFWFYLDMKEKRFSDADQIVAMIQEYGLYNRTILASVDPIFSVYVEQKYPKVNTALERFDFFQVWLYRLIPTRWKPDFLSGFARKVTPSHVEWLKRNELLSKRIVYDVTGPEYDRMLEFGIPMAIVDYDPAVHRAILK